MISIDILATEDKFTKYRRRFSKSRRYEVSDLAMIRLKRWGSSRVKLMIVQRVDDR